MLSRMEKSIEFDFDIKELPIYTDFKMFKTKVHDVHIHLEIGKNEEDKEYDILQHLVISVCRINSQPQVEVSRRIPPLWQWRVSTQIRA